MKHSLKIGTTVVVAFTIYFILDSLYFYALRGSIDEVIHQPGLSHILAYITMGTPLVLGAFIIHPANKVAGGFGLNRSLFLGLIFGLICTLPMFLGYALVYDWNPSITFNGLLISVVSAAFFEEVFFRGFLYGQLYRYTKLGFLPSVIAGAFLFAFIHLYQSEELGRLIGIFMTTFLGAGLFAWVYSEWGHNIWVPVFVHLFMNLFWMIFAAGEDALGGGYANVFRVITIALVIILTIVYKRRRGLHLEINKGTICFKKSTLSTK